MWEGGAWVPATGVRPWGRGLCVRGASDWSEWGSGCWLLGWDHRPKCQCAKKQRLEGTEWVKLNASPWCETVGYRGLAHVFVVAAASPRAGECVKSQLNEPVGRWGGLGAGHDCVPPGARGQQVGYCKNLGSPDQFSVCYSVSPRTKPQGGWLLGPVVTPQPQGSWLLESQSALSVCVAGCTSSWSGAVFVGACMSRCHRLERLGSSDSYWVDLNFL